VSVCMLTRCQKPKATFTAPTYPIGGSDSSHTRQGGISIIFVKLATIVFALLGGNMREEKKREYRILGSAETDFSIDSNQQISFKTGRSGLSPTQKILPNI
jgi:hypothetical protein